MNKHGSKLYDLRPLVDAGRAGETNVNVTGFQVLPKDVARTTMSEDEFNSDATVRGKYYDETIASVLPFFPSFASVSDVHSR